MIKPRSMKKENRGLHYHSSMKTYLTGKPNKGALEERPSPPLPLLFLFIFLISSSPFLSSPFILFFFSLLLVLSSSHYSFSRCYSLLLLLYIFLSPFFLLALLLSLLLPLFLSPFPIFSLSPSFADLVVVYSRGDTTDLLNRLSKVSSVCRNELRLTGWLFEARLL